MQVEPLLGDGTGVGRHPRSGIRVQQPVEGIRGQRGDGAESQRREVQHARRLDLRRSLMRRERGRFQRADRLEVAAALVQLESPPLGAGDGFGGRRQSATALRRGLGGAGEQLHHLLEGRGVGLDEGGGAWSGLWRWRRCRRSCCCCYSIVVADASTTGGGVGGDGMRGLDWVVLHRQDSYSRTSNGDAAEERERERV